VFASAYDAVSDPRLALVLQASLASLAISLLLIVSIVVLRIRLRIDERARARFRALWRPRFALAVAGEIPPHERIRAAQAREALSLVLDLAASLEGDGRARLAAYARACGLEAALAELLHGNLADQLLATNAAGHIGTATLMHALEQLSAQSNPAISLSAARAMLRIAPQDAFARLRDAILSRPDWPDSRLLVMLREAGTPELHEHLVQAMDEASGRSLVRLLHLVRIVRPERIAIPVHRLLLRETDPEILAGCLRLVVDPRAEPAVRTLLGHPAWFVRLQAYAALGRIGTRADLQVFLEALGDPVWWVRQRAAEAVVSLPGVGVEDLESLQRAAADGYATDALRRALAEKTGS